MTDQLRKRIERLEAELDTQHFRGLFDNKGQEQKLKKLKKYRKQLALLEGTPIEQAVPVRNPAQAARKAEMSTRAGKRGRADDHAEALRSRFEFYVENVQPSVDYLKTELGGDAIALIDAHQPAYVMVDDERVFHLRRSIENVVATTLRSLGVPRVIVRDLLERRRDEAGDD